MSVRPRHFLLLGLLSLSAACTRAPTPGVARGEALYATCGKCHGDNGAGNAALGAPAIGGLPAWYVQAQLEGFKQGHRGYDPFDTNGIRMKSVSWSLDRPGDDSSVALYVATLQPGRMAPVLTGNAETGFATFNSVCANCHGQSAAGNPDMHAPPLAGRSDWYLIAQLRKFKSGARGAHPSDMWGATMRAQAMMLDDAAMHNVLAYIQTLSGSATP